MQSTDISIIAEIHEASLAADDVRLLRFSIVKGAVRKDAGAHLEFDIPSVDKSVKRSYSLVDDGKFPEYFTIAVKKERHSRGGSDYMWSLAPGDKVKIVGFGNSMPVSYSAQSYLLIAGGIGVTPLTGIARRLKGVGKQVKMIYSARAPEYAAFRESLSDTLGEDIDFYFSEHGYRADIESVIESLSPDTVVYFCGPLSLSNAIKSAWEKFNFPVQNLRYETFANSGNVETQGFSVTVVETGRSIDIPADKTLLEALIQSGHEVMYGCQKGECGLCKVDIVDKAGEIDHRDVFFSEREKQDGQSLCACVSRLSGGNALIHIDGIRQGRTS